MDALPGIWALSPLGGMIGLMVLLYWFLVSGRIIPRASHEREISQANIRGDEWKDTAMDQREVNQEIRRQNTLLLEATRTTSTLLAEIEVEGDSHASS